MSSSTGTIILEGHCGCIKFKHLFVHGVVGEHFTASAVNFNIRSSTCANCGCQRSAIISFVVFPHTGSTGIDTHVITISLKVSFLGVLTGGARRAGNFIECSSEAVQTQRVDVQFLQIDVDGLAIFVANLDGQFIFGAIENVNAVEVGGFRNTFDFVQTCRDLFFNGVTVVRGVSTVFCLNGQFTDTL